MQKVEILWIKATTIAALIFPISSSTCEWINWPGWIWSIKGETVLARYSCSANCSQWWVLHIIHRSWSLNSTIKNHKMVKIVKISRSSPSSAPIKCPISSSLSKPWRSNRIRAIGRYKIKTVEQFCRNSRAQTNLTAAFRCHSPFLWVQLPCRS